MVYRLGHDNGFLEAIMMLQLKQINYPYVTRKMVKIVRSSVFLLLYPLIVRLKVYRIWSRNPKSA